MNLKSISFYLSLFCFPVSFLAFINILYASYFDYFLSIDTYFITLISSVLLGLSLMYYGKKSPKNINFIEQLILIICVYVLISVLVSIPFYLGGTALLIVVVVMIDFITQVQSHLFQHQYEGLLKKTKLKGRR